MENASKALIIAGAILIAIVLISLGVILINRSKGTSKQASDTANIMENRAQAGVTQINSQSSGLYEGL